MNLREQFDRDTKGHAHFNAYCRAEVDKRPTSEADVYTSESFRRDMFAKYPLGRPCLDAEWLRLWDELGRYLEALPRLEEISGWCTFFVKYKRHHHLRTVRQCLTYGVTRREYHPSLPMRVALLDGIAGETMTSLFPEAQSLEAAQIHAARRSVVVAVPRQTAMRGSCSASLGQDSHQEDFTRYRQRLYQRSLK